MFVGTSNGRDSADEKVPAPKAPSFLAVNKRTGKVLWQDNSPGEGILHGQWASAALGTVDGVPQVAIFPGGDGWVYAFNARSGETLWKFDMNPKDAIWPRTRNYGVATPVFSGGRVLVSTGRECGASEQSRTHVHHRPRGARRHVAIRPGLAVQPDQPVHFDDGGGRRGTGLRRRSQRDSALPGRRDREGPVDVRHDGYGVGLPAGG